MKGNTSSAQVNSDPTCLTSFGDGSTEPLALPRRDDALVDKAAAAPKPCLSPVEVRMLTTAGGLLPAGTAPSATRTNFHQPPLWFCLTEAINFRRSFQYAPYYINFGKMTVLGTKSREILMFDPDASTGCLRTCPFWVMCRALLCGEGFVCVPDGTRGWSVFWQKDDLEYNFPSEVQAFPYTKRIAVDRCLSTARLFRGSRKSQTARGGL